jgi:protein involved in ribonucleotide reduction
MLLVYLSLTGNVKRFVQQVGMESIEISHSNISVDINQDYIFICPTYNTDITDLVSKFIDYNNNVKYLIGFAGSGNRNFDNEFCFNANDLSKKYNKPLIFKFEFSGTDKDILQFKEEVNKFEISRVE